MTGPARCTDRTRQQRTYWWLLVCLTLTWVGGWLALLVVALVATCIAAWWGYWSGVALSAFVALGAAVCVDSFSRAGLWLLGQKPGFACTEDSES